MNLATQEPREGTEEDYCYLYVHPPGETPIPFGFPILIRDAEKAVRKLRKIRAFDFLEIGTMELSCGTRHTEEREERMRRVEAEWEANRKEQEDKPAKKSKRKRKAVVA